MKLKNTNNRSKSKSRHGKSNAYQCHFGFFGNFTHEFGGSKLIGKRKTARPISTKYVTHLILKSNHHRYFNPTHFNLQNLIRKHAGKYNIVVHKMAFVWNHIHLAIEIPTRSAYKAFIRTITAMMVTHLSKLTGKNLKGLFDLRPFTRILSGWGREFKALLNYIEDNQQEALGLRKREKKSNHKNKVKTRPLTV